MLFRSEAEPVHELRHGGGVVGRRRGGAGEEAETEEEEKAGGCSRHVDHWEWFLLALGFGVGWGSANGAL